MGYTTDFEGEFTVEPTLTKEQAAYLKAFSDTRRMMRDADKADNIRDPLRDAVGLPVGKEGEYFVAGRGFMGQDKDESVIDSNREPSTQPGLWCQWEPNEDGTKLRWNGTEKFYSYVEWLEYIDTNFLKPWGRKLVGAVSWQGEDSSDYGLLTAGEVGIHALPGVRATDNLETPY
jgi:hypothetical protein